MTSSPWSRRLLAAAGIFGLVFLTVPLLIVIPMSFSPARALTFPPPGFSLRWYQSLLATPAWGRAFAVSTAVMAVSALIATALGTAAALALAERRSALLAMLRGLLMAPLIVPQIVTGAGIFLMFDAIGLTGTIPGLVLAHAVLAIPYVVATVGAALAGLDRRLEQAALSLGASPAEAFRRVTLPLILPGVLSGLLFAAVLSFDELIVSLFLASPETRTVTVLMWSNVLGEVDPAITAIATLLLAVSLLALGGHALLSRRRAVAPLPAWT